MQAQIDNAKTLLIAQRIADRVIGETTFALINSAQKPVLNIQVIDFSKVLPSRSTKPEFALAKISVKENTKLNFGISYTEPVKVWINNKLVFYGKDKGKFHFKEIAYSIYSFQDTLAVQLNKGMNRIIIESPGGSNALIYLRELTGAEEKPRLKMFPIVKNNHSLFVWGYITNSKKGVMIRKNSDSENNLVDSLFSEQFLSKVQLEFPKTNIIKRLAINKGNIYNKDSFADWNYPNGILMMAMMGLSKATGDERYHIFVRKYCDFIEKNLPVFKKQYFDDHDLRTSYYRIFRKCMLDDAGAPALPFAELSLYDKVHDYDSLLFEMADYVLYDQPRLPDGTLCRPEPVKWTIWADDLFMSVPLLVRMGRLTNRRKYYDEAEKQIINFNKYLYDPQKKLYKHGWFSKTDRKSKIFWGRANGWIIWAESDALTYLPKDNKNYKKVETIFINHIKGILDCQDINGMWHQVLDDKKSFEETSCTAMFIIALAKGITGGILDKNLSTNVFNAWKALQTKITSAGVVKDICCGTGIGDSKEFYETRQRYDNDPRGLGAIICADVEVSKLEKYLKK
ncbi:MAG TPA: glycoside hydrolase family 88 protein [Ignavibacteriaceae bacterium]|nr:glycoside hydrolase family 88 protein [Ignavibacteriaceae bacterium]